jgi:hypothetical protein
MRFRAGLTSCKLALFSRSGTTSRTTDSEYLFGGEFFFRGAFNRTFDVSFRRPIVCQKLSVDFSAGGDFADNLRLRVGLAARTP